MRERGRMGQRERGSVEEGRKEERKVHEVGLRLQGFLALLEARPFSIEETGTAQRTRSQLSF